MAAAPLPEMAEDPEDPQVILRDLPEREHARFLAHYREIAEGALDPGGYRRLREMLHFWSLVVVATNSPGYYERTDPDRPRGRTIPAEEVFPDWDERIAAARAAKA
jgi:hypothetical protein